MDTRCVDDLIQTGEPQTFQPICCFIDPKSKLGEGCNNYAEWEIVHGERDSDNTQSCTEHIGYLLTDAPIHYIYPIGKSHKQPKKLADLIPTVTAEEEIRKVLT